jgi:uncharacterized membrane protein
MEWSASCLFVAIVDFMQELVRPSVTVEVWRSSSYVYSGSAIQTVLSDFVAYRMAIGSATQSIFMLLLAKGVFVNK